MSVLGGGGGGGAQTLPPTIQTCVNFHNFAEGAIDSEAMRARGIILNSKIQLVGQKYRESKNFSWLKQEFNPFLLPKSPRFSLLVGYNNHIA